MSNELQSEVKTLRKLCVDSRALFDALKPIGDKQKRIHKSILNDLNMGDHTWESALAACQKAGIKDYRDVK